jgi:hypothetical protein
MMYMLIPEICSEHASLLYVLESVTVCTVMERIIISKYNYNKICDVS